MSDTDVRDLRQDQIALMVEDFYNRNEILHIVPYGYYAEKVIAKYLDSNLSLDAIRRELEKLVEEKKKHLNAQFDPTIVQKNHEFIYAKLRKLIKLLNRSGADYHLAGALAAYVYYGIESTRVHDDIDIHINEKDINKLKNACEAMGLKFHDKRLNSPRVLINGIPTGKHEISATSDKSDFHIGAFCFERMTDGSIISKGYYHDENNKACAREVILSPELAKEIYTRKPIYFHDLPVFITSPEYLYSLKNYTRTEKDLVDIAFLEKHIDREKLARMRILSKTDKHVQCVRVNGLPATSKINRKAIENDNSELSKMLVHSEKPGDANPVEEKPVESPVEEKALESSIEESPVQLEEHLEKPAEVTSQVSPIHPVQNTPVETPSVPIPTPKEEKPEKKPEEEHLEAEEDSTEVLEETKKSDLYEMLQEVEEREEVHHSTARPKDLIQELDSFHEQDSMKPQGLGEFKTYFKQKRDRFVEKWNDSDETGFTTKDNILIILFLVVGLTVILLLILTK